MNNDLSKLTKLIRYYILRSTTEAGSGHPSSSLSAAELTAGLFFGGFFHFDLDNPENPNNDRLIFSKGHASPLFYSLWAAAGAIEAEELSTMRKFGSRLEGHPTMAFPYTEAATGSLGQGLSIGFGMALNAKYLDKLSYKTYVLLGDSEMAEGSVWEAVQLAAHYKLDNLIGILDVNRLGQRGVTMYGHSIGAYALRIKSFGWEVITLEDGHDLEAIKAALERCSQPIHRPINGQTTGRPTMIIAKTFKGKGVSLLENQDNWHGKPLSADELKLALVELGEVDLNLRGEISKPKSDQGLRIADKAQTNPLSAIHYPSDKPIATRKAYGNAIARVMETNSDIVVLDAETSNSTFAEKAKEKFPERFFEMYIAEQNMAGAALGLARRGKVPFVSTFAAFFSRAFDQIRMSQYSGGNIKFVGSHAGVSIGEDGSSQMGLEDLAMFRTLHNGVVLYPADAIATEKLVEAAANREGNVYIRTTRKDLPIIYKAAEEFPIGGSKVLKQTGNDQVTVVGAGITLYEALAAYEELQKQGINIRVIDLYSIKPIDTETLQKAARETKAIITVEDHYPEGGIGEAVRSVVSGQGLVVSLAVRKMPKSGKPDELMAYEEINKDAIIKTILTLV